ncbi:sarcosine oxidase subunit gamma [Gemmobacter sp.]|uniref:sarcosine oxidase subunit gamma n=1 Tax=Gemmobacter sp. TaxID=1898957 RepID=UPI002AFF7922|nr:sarcosine oxidase subunit gamma family protein [Gemmobacter sp.]
MSDPVTALAGMRGDGYVTVAEAPPVGMITLRCRGDVSAALAALDLPVPARRRIETGAGGGIAWMSPDEWLILLPRARVAGALATLGTALDGVPHLAADVSDARAVLWLEGDRVREVLAKACPVDIAVMEPGEVRRTRAAQIAVAFWMIDDRTAEVICFRSVAHYALDLFVTLARPGSEVGLFD